MIITINQQGGSYYVYKNFTTKKQAAVYVAKNVTGFWNGSLKEAVIYDSDHKQVALIYFKRRFFRISELQIILYQGDRIEINPKNVWSWKDLIWNFDFNSFNYTFQEHRGHNRSLFKYKSQVAAFEKNYFTLLGRDVFSIHTNDDENILLLTCLAIYGDLGNNKGTMLSMNYGNLNGTKAPLNGKWRPHS